MKDIGQMIKNRRKELGLTQLEVARRTGIAREVVSKIENGKENITIGTLNVIVQKGLGSSLNFSFADNVPEHAKEKKYIIDMVKTNGGLWSYDLAQSDFAVSDEFIIENGLRHLDLEQMHYLFEIYDRDKIYQIWEKKLLSQGRRLSTLNLVLAAVVFKIQNSLEFVNSYER